MKPKLLYVFGALLVGSMGLDAEDQNAVLAYRYPEARAAVYKTKGTSILNMMGTEAKMMEEFRTTERLVGIHEDGSFVVSADLSDVHESTFVSSQLIQREVPYLFQFSFGIPQLFTSVVFHERARKAL